jgi:two-component system cell cycle sensor histidine kinase/response regulator CckA
MRMPAILIVDDELPIRTLVALSLQAEGFTVFPAANGREALDTFHQHADEIDVVLTDVVMPEMDGPALVRELVAERPQLRVIFTSGYCGSNDLDTQSTYFLAKPFDINDLVATVQTALNEGETVIAA